MVIQAVYPRETSYVNGVLTEDPPYQPPRWKCDYCGVERPVLDDAFGPRYKDPDEAPTFPSGWIRALVVPLAPGYQPEKEWHFCSLDCVRAYQGW